MQYGPRLWNWEGLRILRRAACGAAFLWLASELRTLAEPTPREVVEASSIQGGFVVHLGCSDGTLTAALGAKGQYVVQGLAVDSVGVQKARAHIRKTGLYGRVSVDTFDGRHLPYVDNLVDLVVISRNGGGVQKSELLRVLRPGGVALDVRHTPFTVLRKPWPREIDDWTHFLHGPDGRVMSNDLVVGPPYHIQWIGRPAHSRSHAHLTTVNVMVSSGGRLFYIADVSPTALPNALPSRWALIARDAFNGIELWRRPLSEWQPYDVKDRNSYPADLHRRLVAAGDVVFVTLSIHGPVSALDAATGRTRRTYAHTEKTEDIVYENGVLYLSVNTGDAKQIDRRRMAYRHVEPRQKRLMAINAKSGELIWEKADRDTDGLMPMTLAVKTDRVYFQNDRAVVCLAKATGKALWRGARPSDYVRPGWSSPTLVAFDDVVISADRQSGPGQKVGKDKFAAGGFSTGNLVAFSAADGKRLWSVPCAEGCRAPTDVFGLNGKLWFGQSLERRIQEYRQAYDLRTGRLLKETPAAPDWPTQHHHRCYRDKATRRYILANRTGVEFIDLKTGEVKVHNWVRGNCKFGVLPANGLLYLPPDQCGCYVESKLTGFYALAPKRPGPPLNDENDETRLQRGPAYGQIENQESRIENAQDWPTFRADRSRSGRAATTVSPLLRVAWCAELGGRLTPPVVANGRAFVAARDAHTLYALSADTGKLLWSFAAGGRIDSPPTVARGLVVFGSHDGWVYALRSADGRLAWRYRAARDDRRLVDNGQPESVWPVAGSVLVQNGAVYLAAGRSSYVDGGVCMGKLDLLTGHSLVRKTFYSRDPKTGNAVKLYEPFPGPRRLVRMEMPGVLPDVLSSDGRHIWMRAVTLDSNLNIQPEFPPHLFCSMGFLDESWWELTYWIYGKHMFSGRTGIGYAVGLYPTARIMVCDDRDVYGYQEGYERIRTPAFVAFSKEPKRHTFRRRGRTYSRVLPTWKKGIPLHVFGLVLAGDTLFMAGPPRIDTAKTRALMLAATTDAYKLTPLLKEAIETFMGRRGGLLYALKKADGATVMEMKLQSVPVFDGLIAANGRLYMSTKNGRVLCLK